MAHHRWVTRHLVAALLVFLLGEFPAYAQSAGLQQPSPTIDVGLPSDTEVVQPGRAAINPERSVPFPPLEAPLDPDKYMIGHGDVLELNFWGAQNFKLRVPIDLEGRTFISKVGYVDTTNKSLSEARAIIKKAVLRYFPGLSVDVSLLEPRTFLVHVVENVVHPGVHPARAVDRISTVLARAGGVLEGSSHRRILIQRIDGSVVPVDLFLYTLTGDTANNPYVHDGDIIRVPFADFTASIKGAVRRPGTFELIHEKDLSELLELAGGVSITATRKLPIRLVRRDTDERLVQTLIAFPDSGLPNMPLRAEDQVWIPSEYELERTVVLVGAIQGAVATDEATHVRRMDFVEGDTARSLLERAGGVLAAADLTGSSIAHQDGTQTPLDLEALLVRRDFSADQPVRMGDTVLIPFLRRGVQVEGAVFKPTIYPFKPQFSLLDYIGAAGGPTRFAQDTSDVRLITTEGKMLPFAPTLKVSPGDTIVVPERHFTRAEIVQLVISGVGLLISTTALVIAADRLK